MESEHCSLLFPLGKLRLGQGLVGGSPALSRSIRFLECKGTTSASHWRLCRQGGKGQDHPYP